MVGGVEDRPMLPIIEDASCGGAKLLEPLPRFCGDSDDPPRSMVGVMERPVAVAVDSGGG
jgi:hypothetical protein